MPKFFGTSLLGILIATIAFYMVGFLWYGFLFTDPWMAAAGMTEASAQAHAEKLGPMMYIGGLLITLAQVLGLSYILNQSSASLLGTCVKICAMIAVLIALPIMLYANLYEGRSMSGLYIDFSHVLVAYGVVGAVLSFFRGKDAIGD